MMPSAPVAWYAEGFADAIGDRLQMYDSSGPGLELLRFAPQLAVHGAFERALRTRVEQLEPFRHPAFARVRRVTTLDDPRPQVALVSELVPGERLSRVLQAARTAGIRVPPDAVFHLLRQLVPALAVLHDNCHVTHGLMTADRIKVTPSGDLLITEYVLAGAVQSLGFSRAELWWQFGLATGAGATFDPATDVMQVALLSLGLLADHPVQSDEYPDRLASLLDTAMQAVPADVGPGVHHWFVRALALDQAGFRSAYDASIALEHALAGRTGAWATALLPAGSMAVTAPARSDQQSAVKPRRALEPLTGRDRPLRLLAAAAGVDARTASAPANRRLLWMSAALGTMALAEAVCLAWLLLRGPAIAANQATAPSDLAAPIDAFDDTATAATVATVESDDRVPTVPPARRPVTQHLSPRGSSTVGGVAVEHASLSRTDAVIGWVSIDADVELRVYANGRLLGSAEHARYRLPEGDHDITLVNDELGFRSTQPVQITAGRTVSISPAIPPSTSSHPIPNP
jgi:hypothetical protein